MNNPTASLKTKIALWLAIILWASAFPGIRAGLEGYSPGSLALLRFLVASLCMSLMQFTVYEKTKVTWKDRGYLILIGMFGLGIYNIALNYGEIAVTAGIASFIISVSPIMTLIIAAIFLKEIITIKRFIGMLISMVGIGVITLSKTDYLHFQIGFLYVTIAMIVGGIYTVLQKPLLRKYHAITVTSYIIWGATILLLFYFPSMLQHLRTASFHSTASVIFLGIFPASAGYLAWSYGVKEVPVSQAVNYLYFMPIIATLMGWIWLGEIPAMLALLGGLIALFGVWIAGNAK